MRLIANSTSPASWLAAPLLMAATGCAASGYHVGGPQDVLPSLAATAPRKLLPSPSDEGTPDITVIRNERGCTATITPSWKRRAETEISKMLNTGYASFPIDRNQLVAGVMTTFFGEPASTICTALTAPSGATRENHIELREKYKSSSLGEAEGDQRGVITRRISAAHQCPSHFDWSSASAYHGVHQCHQVLNKIGTAGIPVSLFAIEIPPHDALNYLDAPTVAPFHTRYANSGPIICGEGPGYYDSYHSLYVSPLWSNLNFIVRTQVNDHWITSSMLHTCSTTSGQTFTADDLMFVFSMRLFLGAKTVINGTPSEKTFVISSAAAASDSWAASLLPKNLPYHRLIASEYVKRVVLEAAANGW